MEEQVRGMGSKCGRKTGGWDRWDMEGSGGTKEGGMGGGG